MKITILIPARLASTRLPEKMLADLHGKPLIIRTYEQAKKSKLATDVIIVTDDKKIIAAAEAHGCKAVMTPIGLKTGTDRIAFASQKLNSDVFVNLQGDEPLIKPKMIDQAIEPILADRKVQCSTLVRPLDRLDDELIKNPSVVKVALAHSGDALYFSRSPIPYLRNTDAPVKYYKHIGIYAFRRAVLQSFSKLPHSALEAAESLEQLRLLESGISIRCAFTKLDSQAVDTAEDLELVRKLMRPMRTAAV
ncbi:MAG: 3-deoxy-manno-octulosonate cytidylyltransferase [Rhizobacter sp.]|nr:3-deoxy-manno-octulosonate cytidylyltransferase [Chlorobiales bacterium]